MKKCIIAGLLVAVLSMSIFPITVLADSPEDPGKPWRPDEPFQEPYMPLGVNAEQGEDTPFGHDLLDGVGRIYYIGRVESYYPEE